MSSKKRSAPASDPPLSSKKSRTTSAPAAELDDDGNPYWELSSGRNERRITVSAFKNMNMINIREYYDNNGKMLPGKKGISLTVEQYERLLAAIPQVEKELLKRGARVSRPEYEERQGEEGEDGKGEEDVEEEESGEGAEAVKENFEATSEEDEG